MRPSAGGLAVQHGELDAQGTEQLAELQEADGEFRLSPRILGVRVPVPEPPQSLAGHLHQRVAVVVQKAPLWIVGHLAALVLGHALCKMRQQTMLGPQERPSGARMAASCSEWLLLCGFSGGGRRMCPAVSHGSTTAASGSVRSLACLACGGAFGSGQKALSRYWDGTLMYLL